MAIGLEYVLKLNGMSKTELASILKVKRPNITAWINYVKGEDNARRIPKHHLEKLCELFPDISQDVFQKELTEAEKKKIVKRFIQNIAAQHDIKVTIH